MMSESQAYNAVYLLWSGGWDSTYRLLELILVEKRKVQPIYLIEHERKSSLNELAAMAIIRNKIIEKEAPAASLLLPTRVFVVTEIAMSQTITEKFKSLSSRYRLGSQFEWLPRFAKEQQLNNLELAIEKNELRPRDPFFAYLGQYLRTENGVRKLADTVPDKDLLIFKYFHFPVYYQTKLEMLTAAKKNGFYELMLDSWFCHRPRNGKPCGICHPCIDAMEEGFAFRVPPMSRAMYHLNKLLSKSKTVVRARLCHIEKRFLV